MSFEQFVTGVVFRYPYLWGHQADRGETEGRKDRPVVVGFRLKQRLGVDRIVVLPITSKEPDPGRFSSEIPASEKRRAGLNTNMRLWLILDDANSDVLGKSHYLEEKPPLGRFSKSYILPLLHELISRREEINMTDRTK